MEEAYQILPTSGKGWGMFASTFIKRGTLILKEEPQIPVVYQPFMPNSFDKYLQVISHFYQMSDSDQIDYMLLHDEVSSSEKLQLLEAITEEIKGDAKKSRRLSKNKLRVAIFILLF